uniref:RRM domain-containing protein n=1 Tax=Rhizophagus irregularis (strain DAOM 181602 / DAOM 197198 / MUCL 43194) TaxID=747089 RepID=U9T114_RHIID
MPCSLTLDQKKSCREFVTVLSQLPPNTKDVHLAPLVRAIGAMAINIPLSLNSYKPKRWAYITFKSQQMMDSAMEQGRSCTRNPIAHLKERFNIGQSNNNNSSANRSRQCSRSQSKDRSNSRQHNHSANNTGRKNNNINNPSSPNSADPTNPNQSAQCSRSNEHKGKDRSVSFSTFQHHNTFASNSSGHKPPLVNPNCSQIQEILSVLKSLQEDMASVCARIHALELADQRMSQLELRVFGHKQDDVLTPDPNNSPHMLVDNHQSTPLYNTI